MHCNVENVEVKLEVTKVLHLDNGDKILRKCNQERCIGSNDNECLLNKLISTKII